MIAPRRSRISSAYDCDESEDFAGTIGWTSSEIPAGYPKKALVHSLRDGKSDVQTGPGVDPPASPSAILSPGLVPPSDSSARLRNVSRESPPPLQATVPHGLRPPRGGPGRSPAFKTVRTCANSSGVRIFKLDYNWNRFTLHRSGVQTSPASTHLLIALRFGMPGISAYSLGYLKCRRFLEDLGRRIELWKVAPEIKL